MIIKELIKLENAFLFGYCKLYNLKVKLIFNGITNILVL